MLSILHRCDSWGKDCQRESHLLRRKSPSILKGKQCVLGIDSSSGFFGFFFCILRGAWGCPHPCPREKKNINTQFNLEIFFKVLILMWHSLQYFPSFSLYSPWWPFIFKGCPYRKLRDRLDFT